MLIEHTPANESYEPHYDYYHDISRLAVAGHRVATVLMYLSTISQGGETIFPQLEVRLLIQSIAQIFMSMTWMKLKNEMIA